MNTSFLSCDGSVRDNAPRDNAPRDNSLSDALLWTAPPEALGERIDKALARALSSISRSEVQALIAAGEIRANGSKVVRASQRIKPGQIFELRYPSPASLSVAAENIPLDILFEDSDLLILDKPPGLVVHPAVGHWHGTLVNALLYHTQLSNIGAPYRPGIVHRLDKDTSGIMVVAKQDHIHRDLTAQLAERSLRREYEAVVWGVPSVTQGRIDARVGRHLSHRQKMAAFPASGSLGREAQTEYRVTQTFGRIASLLHCRLISGRTHQIRVHLCSLGHPIIGDGLYGARPAALNQDSTGCLNRFARQALHARALFLCHPQTGIAMTFKSKRPVDLDDLIASLRRISSCQPISHNRTYQ